MADDVYFILNATDGCYKIGVGANPLDRLAVLQTGQAAPLYMMACIPGGGAKLERELHRRFAASRLAGEWFKPTPELIALVEEVRRTGDVRGSGFMDTSPAALPPALGHLRLPAVLKYARRSVALMAANLGHCEAYEKRLRQLVRISPALGPELVDWLELMKVVRHWLEDDPITTVGEVLATLFAEAA